MGEPQDDVGFEFKFAQTTNGDGPNLSDYNFNPSFGSLANSIRKSSRSLGNRLRSIKKDSEFVESVAEVYHLPIVTNARAGDWYVDPKKGHGSVYFKSTDGHAGQWKFSSRRLNLGLLEIIENGRGVIIVDSTRRGKRFPDSLSKTIPIWISVMNSVCFPADGCTLFTNDLAVSPSEASCIEKQLYGFVENFLALGLDLEPIKRVIKKPLKPIWVTPDSTLPLSPPEFTDFIPLVLVTASRMTKGDGMEGEYIQGAGDDHEGWASESGLTPEIFWENHQALLEANEGELLELSRTLVGSYTKDLGRTDITLIKPTKHIFIGTLASAKVHGNNYEVIVSCSTEPLDIVSKKCQVIEFPIPSGKRGAKFLRAELGKIVCLMDKNLGRRTLFACPSGGDVAPSIALVILCLYYDDEGQFRRLENLTGIDKSFIRRRLAWISSSRPEANPSRSLLNAVNSFLMERPI